MALVDEQVTDLPAHVGLRPPDERARSDPGHDAIRSVRGASEEVDLVGVFRDPQRARHLGRQAERSPRQRPLQPEQVARR